MKHRKEQERHMARSVIKHESVLRQFAKVEEADLSIADRERVLIRQNGRCFYCGTALGQYVLDHFVPRSRGGSHYPHNRVAACGKCDCAKGGRLPTLEERIKLARQLTEYL